MRLGVVAGGLSARALSGVCRVAVVGVALALLPTVCWAQEALAPPTTALDEYLDAQSSASVDLASKQKHPAVYPDNERRLGIQGTALLIVTVDALGAPVNVTVERSSRNRALDRAAIDAARHWRYVPARLQGKAVVGKVRVPVDFSIDTPLPDNTPGDTPIGDRNS